ncbi:hypothetical protein Franean1_4410 [Parafrankia sp. EAN1pec]|nr:hypothetical protein Franean1_4410 [Frankia sp. EAN1pec]
MDRWLPAGGIDRQSVAQSSRRRPRHGHPDNKTSPVVFDPLHDLGEPTVSGVRTAHLYNSFVTGGLITDIAKSHHLSE